MVREDLKDAIQAFVDEYHEKRPGVRTVRIGMLPEVLDVREGIETTRNEVEVACDELVEEDRLRFVKDSGKAGRRYASMQADEARVNMLRDR